MNADNTLKLQQSPDAPLCSGYWKLAPARAVTLNPSEAGILRVASGQVWATFDGPHHGPANDWGDLVLHGGEQLRLEPGQHVVIERFDDAVNEPVYFSWEPAGGPALAAPADASAWCDVLARPSLANDDEIMVSVRALGRGLSAIGRFLSYFVAGRGRVLSPLEMNQP